MNSIEYSFDKLDNTQIDEILKISHNEINKLHQIKQFTQEEYLKTLAKILIQESLDRGGICIVFIKGNK